MKRERWDDEDWSTGQLLLWLDEERVDPVEVHTRLTNRGFTAREAYKRILWAALVLEDEAAEMILWTIKAELGWLGHERSH